MKREEKSPPFFLYFPETVIPLKAAQGSTVYPSATISREIASYILQHIRKIAGNHGFAYRIGNFSVLYEKAVLCHPEKSPLVLGCPPEKRPTKMPLSMDAIIS